MSGGATCAIAACSLFCQPVIGLFAGGRWTTASLYMMVAALAVANGSTKANVRCELCYPASVKRQLKMPINLDRNEDGIYDSDDLLQGTDPTALDRCRRRRFSSRTNCRTTSRRTASLSNCKRRRCRCLGGSTSAPRCGIDPKGTVKATLTVSSVTSGESYASPLPRQNWALLGPDENPYGYKYADKTLAVATVSKLTWRRGKDLKATLTGKGTVVLTDGHRRASLAR
jgi:hypothetical protein